MKKSTAYLVNYANLDAPQQRPDIVVYTSIEVMVEDIKYRDAKAYTVQNIEIVE